MTGNTNPPDNLTAGGLKRAQYTQDQIIRILAVQTNMTIKESQYALWTLAGIIRINLKRGHSIGIPNFGTFSVGKRTARSGTNPRTGAVIKIVAAKLINFRVREYLRNQL